MTIPPQQLRARIGWPDDRLLAECAVDTYRASGPGGQKRNKTSSAVRLRHQPSGLVAQGEESRSQHENKARALRRLREALILSVRLPPEPVAWPRDAVNGAGTLRMNSKRAEYLECLGRCLDAFAHFDGDLRQTADWLAVTSSSLVRFLAENPHAWAVAERLRTAASKPPLRKP
jgi:hypothetical protein